MASASWWPKHCKGPVSVNSYVDVVIHSYRHRLGLAPGYPPDNDRPLPPDVPTFGFTTAVDKGTDLVQLLMKAAATTDQGFFVTVMGRHTGHLALGIGGGGRGHPHRDRRTVRGCAAPARGGSWTSWRGRSSSAAPRAGTTGSPFWPRGFWEKLDPETFSGVPYDSFGNVRREALALSPLLKPAGSASLSRRAIEVGIVATDLGYELRCAPSIAEGLGYWAYALPARGGNRGDGHDSGRPLRSHSFRDMIDLRGT